MQIPEVVILGGGFGGLEAAKALERAPVRVTLIDRQNHHGFQPLLYQVATAALSAADVAWPIRHILKRQKNTRVVMAEVTGIDRDARSVHTSQGTFPFDYLVVATGSTHSYFGHEEWAADAPGLKQIEDAIAIRRRFLTAFERAEVAEDDRERLLTFVIVGGGSTGVEMAGAIAEVARQTLNADFRHIDPRTSRIFLIEAGPRILPMFPERLSLYAQTTLERMGVTVKTSTRVVGCDANGVALDGQQPIPAATIIWAAGVAASPAARWLDVAQDHAGRVKVGPDLSVPGHANIFVIGDTAAVTAGDRLVPGIAPAAKQMGAYVGRLIAGRLRAGAHGREKPFRYRHAGDLAAIARNNAIVKLRRIQLKGVIGWLFWSVVHIFFLISLRNRLLVAFSWFWEYVTFQRGARLIVRDPTDRT
jgi:NADH dehydrogenase